MINASVHTGCCCIEYDKEQREGWLNSSWRRLFFPFLSSSSCHTQHCSLCRPQQPMRRQRAWQVQAGIMKQKLRLQLLSAGSGGLLKLHSESLPAWLLLLTVSHAAMLDKVMREVMREVMRSARHASTLLTSLACCERYRFLLCETSEKGCFWQSEYTCIGSSQPRSSLSVSAGMGIWLEGRGTAKLLKLKRPLLRH